MNLINKLFLTLTLTLAASTLHAAGLQDFKGNAKTINDFAGNGKWLVVMIWAHDCHVCNQEASHYDLFHDARKNKDASVLGISLDGQARKDKAEEFITRHQISFPNLIGEPSAVMDTFSNLTGVAWVGTPTFLIYNPEGKLVVQQIGAVPVNLIEAYIERNS